MTPKAVLFDCDGVLVDSEPITDRVVIANLARHGLAVSEDDVAELFLGGTLRGIGEAARARGADLPEDWLDGLYAETYRALEAGTPVVDGVPALLDRLDRSGIPYGVGSNGSREKMKITLGQNGLWSRFESAMVSAHDGLPAKPAPDIYLKLAETLGVAPAEAAVVDDSPAGLKAALAAGIPAIGFAERTPADRLGALGVPTARSMGAVAELLGLDP
ncbi:MAG: HAD family phosphatase [Paracoccaceae bacterium]|nr:HAD family phosphatase [Paracoccaceae bacterium]